MSFDARDLRNDKSFRINFNEMNIFEIIRRTIAELTSL